MFMDELTPLVRELIQQPIAFAGGVFSGIFRLNLMDDPVKSWLDKQTATTVPASTTAMHNGKNQGPQSISID